VVIVVIVGLLQTNECQWLRLVYVCVCASSASSKDSPGVDVVLVPRFGGAVELVELGVVFVGRRVEEGGDGLLEGVGVDGVVGALLGT
jgi:hypothetical protein